MMGVCGQRAVLGLDHGTCDLMDSMPISRFKATCLAALERVRKTGRPLRVTRFGKPMADIVPARPERAASNWLGQRAGTGRILGDITAPTSQLVAWDATK